MSAEQQAQESLLGAILQNPVLMADMRGSVDVSDFGDDKSFGNDRREVYRAMCGLWDQGIKPDCLTVRVHLMEAGAQINFAYFNSLTDGVPASTEVTGLVRQLKTLSNNRRIKVTNQNMQDAFETGDPPSEVLAEHLPRLAKLQEQATAGRKARFELLHWSELDQLPESEFLPGTHLVKDGLNMWYGLSGTAKSFAALRDGYHLSRLGLGAVVYVSPEGKGAWDLRRKAWSEHTGLEPGAMYFYPGAVNLMNDGEVSVFIADMKAKFPNGVLLVVFDTKARMMPGANENDAQDDGVQVANSDRIKDGLKCAVLLIHHSNKADLSARGSYATTNACDCILKFTRDADGLITVSVTWPHGKLKDGEPWPDETFRFVKAGESVVLLPSDRVAAEYSAKLTAQQTMVLEHSASEVFGDSGPTFKEIRVAIPISKVSESGLYAVLKTLIRHGFLLHAAKSDPYKVTQAGHIKLSNSNGTLTQLSESGSPNYSNSLTPLRVRVESCSESRSESEPLLTAQGKEW